MPTGIYQRPKVIRGVFTKGHAPWHKGKTGVYTPEVLEVMRQRKLENPQSYWKGKKRPSPSKETRKKMSDSQKKIGNKPPTIHMYGKLNPMWKGGTTKLTEQIRGLPEYYKWRLKVYERDDFSCKECGDAKGGNLEAHHITPLTFLIKSNGITTTHEARSCQELWDIENGLTLCKQCHAKTNTYMAKAKKYHAKK